ncbi:hypothetical protein HY212_02385 [Candidatus Pacearchaeota archaeon]|nr:hypothetical protein [Candidatus Pacearchaeota archaeon]
MRERKLTKEQKRILTIAGNQQIGKVDLETLAETVGVKKDPKDLNEFRFGDLAEIIKQGYIKSETDYSTRGKPVERFYLREGTGDKIQARLQGHYGPIRRVGAWFRRTFAFIFIISGLAFMLWQDTITNSTGNVIGSSSTLSLDIAFVLSFILMILGGVLLFKSFKK